jgi:hypothetical protein
MFFTLLVITGTTLAFAGPVAKRAITVVGTGNPAVDIPAVQKAVDLSSEVFLKGRFSFDAPPTIVEQPSLLYNGTALGTILVSKTVTITGAPDEQGEMPTIEGGTNPFYVEALGSRVAIQGLRFLHSKVVVIRVVAASGLVIQGNRIEGVARGATNAFAIYVTTVPSPPNAGDGRPENVSGNVRIANNDIDLQAPDSAAYLGIVVFAVGKSPDKEVDLFISGNNIRNSTERPINLYAIGGRAYIERNVINTGPLGINVAPSGDVIHIVGPGSFLIARNTIDCQWASGQQAGIRLQTRPGQAVSHAIVVDNDINMSAPEGTPFTLTSAVIEIRGSGDGNTVLNNRIRGRANFALSVIASTPGTADATGSPQNTVFIRNDLTAFASARADLFVDAGAANTIAVGGLKNLEDHGSGTLIMPLANLRITPAITAR